MNLSKHILSIIKTLLVIQHMSSQTEMDTKSDTITVPVIEEPKYIALNNNKKRRRVTNQIRDGMQTPPKHMEKVRPLEGKLTYKCPAKGGIGKSNLSHDVSISIIDNNFKFTCDCNNRMGEHKSESCVHINMAILTMINSYIDNAEIFNDAKQRYVNILKELNNVSKKFDKLDISE